MDGPEPGAPLTILLVEDDQAEVESILGVFRDSSPLAAITVVASISAAQQALARGAYGLVLASWRLPDGEALALLEPEPLVGLAPVVILDGQGSPGEAVRAMRAGAVDYLAKDSETLSSLPQLVELALRHGSETCNIRSRLQALERSEATLASILNAAPDIIFKLDAEFRVVFINQAVARYGYDSAELIGRDFLELVYAEDRPEMVRRREARRAGEGDSVPYEVRLISRSGQPVLFEMNNTAVLQDEAAVVTISAEGLYDTAAPGSAAFIGIQGVVRDISARKRAEEEVRRLAAVISCSNQGVILISATHAVQYVNSAFERLTGYRADRIVGYRLADTPLLEAAFGEGLERALAAEGPTQAQIEAVGADGQPIVLLMSTNWLLDEAERPTSLVVRLIDISERVRLEEQLRQAGKLDAIGTLAGGIAHDFNNVLAAIMGYAELALSAVPPGSPAAADLGQVLVGGQRASELTRQILTFARKASEERRTLRLSLLMREVLKFLRASLPATIEVQDRIDSESGYVLADPSQMHQLVMNLCTNAYQAMGEAAGTLTVTLEAVTLAAGEAAHAGAGLPAGEYLCLTVADTGPGISPETIGRIFEPFFTTKPVGVGTGLGLAVTHGIVASHGGAIAVESEPGRGTTFRVWLPRHHAAVVDADEEDQLAAGTGSGQVLVVDDEPALATLVARLLQRHGYRTTVGNGANEALRLWRDDPEGFDLLVTDHIMPGLTGLDLANQLRASRPDLPVVLITGYGSTVPDLQADARTAVVTKPLDSRLLAETVQRLLAREAPPPAPTP
jgi:PAS domain S-box-containing protein